MNPKIALWSQGLRTTALSCKQKNTKTSPTEVSECACFEVGQGQGNRLKGLKHPDGLDSQIPGFEGPNTCHQALVHLQLQTLLAVDFIVKSSMTTWLLTTLGL